MSEILLIDLSSVAHPIWHTSQAEPDPNRASQLIVARVRELAAKYPKGAAICCDSGRSFRKDIAESYKANRQPTEAPLNHQIALAREQLEADGFPVWAARGFEADDLIASATSRALAADLAVLVASADKDLLQLVGPRVRAMSTRDGAVFDADAVMAKFGVRPDQMRDYLSLVGDKSDNVPGAKQIGAVKAADLLKKFDSLDNVYTVLDANAGKPTVGIVTSVEMSLREFRAQLPTTRQLITLRSDVEIPFDDVYRERVSRDVATFGLEDSEMETPVSEAAQNVDTPLPAPEQPELFAVPPVLPIDTPLVAPKAEPLPGPAGLVRQGVVMPAPAEYERQLDPRSMQDAIALSKNMYESRMFSAYGSPQAVLSTVMLGRELGLPAMASLRGVHVIEGKHGLAASTMVALVLKSGLAEFFEPISFSETEATYETKRKGARNPVRLTHTFEMAVKAWPKIKADWEKSFNASGWGKNPTDMLVARATARLARMIYPDLLAGLYTPEELAEIREQQQAA